MQHKPVTIINKLGLHARAVVKLVQVAAKFDCDISIVHNDKKVNGKSIMGVMMLAASIDSTIELITSGPDEIIAITELEHLILDRFGEVE